MVFASISGTGPTPEAAPQAVCPLEVVPVRDPAAAFCSPGTCAGLQAAGPRACRTSPKKKGRGGGKDGEGEDAEGETYYDAMKQEMGERAARTKAAMDALDPLQRVTMEGHRAGTYVRLRFTGLNLSCGHLNDVVLQHFYKLESLNGCKKVPCRRPACPQRPVVDCLLSNPRGKGKCHASMPCMHWLVCTHTSAPCGLGRAAGGRSACPETLHRCGSGLVSNSPLSLVSSACEHEVHLAYNLYWRQAYTSSARLAHFCPTCRAALRTAAPLHPVPAPAGGRPDPGRGGFRLHAAALQAPPLVPQDHENPGSPHLLHR